MRATSRFGDRVFSANWGIYAAKFFESRPGRGRYYVKFIDNSTLGWFFYRQTEELNLGGMSDKP
jgi:hypothetical protein